MNIRGTVIGTVVGLVVGGATLTNAQAANAPDLSCATAPDCQVVIDRLYSDVVDLSAEVNDRRRINIRQEHQLERRAEKIIELRKRLRQQP